MCTGASFKCSNTHPDICGHLYTKPPIKNLTTAKKTSPHGIMPGRCDPGEIRNPATGRCVNRDGRLGRTLTAQQQPNHYSNLLYRTKVGRFSNNCYAYALDHYDTKQGHKLQPGDLSGYSTPIDLSSCKDIIQRAKDDAARMGWTLTPATSTTRCPKHGYLIMLVLWPRGDYHWYRKHSDVLYRVKHPRSIASIAKEFGVAPSAIDIPKYPDATNTDTVTEGALILIRGANVWSHKRGLSEEGPLLHDACGKVIKDPGASCRDYGYGTNYHKVCQTFCFKK